MSQNSASVSIFISAGPYGHGLNAVSQRTSGKPLRLMGVGSLQAGLDVIHHSVTAVN